MFGENTIGKLETELGVKQQAGNNQEVQELVNTFRKAAKTMASAMNTVNKVMDKGSKATKEFSDHVWTARGYIKDFSRVATGIILAQAFYTGIRAIKEAVRELWDFNQLLETTKVSLEYFLSDTRNIDRFVNSMETLAATTPYSFEQLASASRMFFRYGFTEQQILPMTKLIADMGAATGATTDQINHLAMAFGQVLAKGRLTAEEAKRQIGQILPINKILQEELGITAEDLGDVFVSAQDGLNAIFNWVNRNYKGAADKMEQTSQGLISSIRDYMLFLGRDLLEGIFNKIKGFLANLRDTLAEARDAFKRGGFTELIKTLFPQNIANALLNFVNAIKYLWQSLMNLRQSLAPLRQELGVAFVNILNFVTSMIANLANVINNLAEGARIATPMVTLLGKAIVGLMIGYAVANAILAITKAVQGVIKMFSGWYGIVMLVVGALVTLLSLIPKVRAWFGGLGDRIASTFGFEVPNAINDTKNALSGISGANYGTEFGDIAEGFNDMGSSAKEASKKINDTFLASFDEVYQIPEKTETDVGAGGLGVSLKIATELDDTLQDIDKWLGTINGIKMGKGAMFNAMQLDDLDKGMNDYWAKVQKRADDAQESFVKINELKKDVFTFASPGVTDMVGAGAQPLETKIKAWTDNWTKMADMRSLAGDDSLFAQLFPYDVTKTTWWSAAWENLKNPTMMQTGQLLRWLGEILRNKFFAFTSWQNTVNNAIAGFFSEIVWEKGIKKFGLWFGNMWNKLINPVFEIMWDSLLIFLEETGIKEWWLESIENIKNNFIGIWGVIVGAFLTNFDNVRMVFESHIASLKASYNLIWGAIREWGIAVWNFLSGHAIQNWNNIKTHAINVWNNIKDWAINLWTIIKTWASAKWDEIKKKAIEIWNNIEAWAKTIWDNLKLWASTKWDDIKKKATGIWNDIETWAKGIWANITGEGKRKWDELKNKAFEVWNNIVSFVTDKWNTIFEKSKTMWGNIKEWAKYIWSQIVHNLISQLNKIPGIDLPEIPVYSPSIQGLATGGVVTRETVVRVGERSVPEAVFPLNEQTMAPFANMIASMMSGLQAPQSNIASDYVLIPVNKRQLERDLFQIRKSESFRIAGRDI